jgi:hypothetical protein
MLNMEKSKRTLQQNKALHKLFTQMSDTFNTLGLDMRVVLKPEIKILWTPEAVKRELFKPVMKAMYGKESTTELTTSEVSKVYEQIALVIGQKHGVEIEFPSKEQLDDYWKDYK